MFLMTCALMVAVPALAGEPTPKPFAWRQDEARAALLKAGGGTDESETAVFRGLAWLAKQQKANGSWAFDGNRKDAIAATGICLLSFLGAGQTQKTGKYTKPVQAGLAVLLAQQKPDGTFTGTSVSYSHAIATLALCEAYGMTGDPKLKGPAQKAIEVIVKGQTDNGSWGYTYGSKTGDTSITGWQIQALYAAKLAGLIVPDDAIVKTTKWLDSIETDAGATYGYAGKGATPNMTAVGLLCRQRIGKGQTPFADGVAFLKKYKPVERNLDLYYLFYAAQVIHARGSKDGVDGWNPKVRELLLGLQAQGQAPNAGSWEPDKAMCGTEGGRLLTTALSVLTLEVYYRYPPVKVKPAKD